MSGIFRRSSAVVLLFVLAGIVLTQPGPAAAEPLGRLDCTFTVKYPIVNVRGGPGVTHERVGSLRYGETFAVIDQAGGEDGYVWWQGAEDRWVRSDLGTSDCPATCGNDVCELGESASTCAADCRNAGSATSTSGTSNSNLTSTGTGCLVGNCQACYESIPCYPACSECTCSRNESGCVTCYCRYPGSSTSSASTSTSASASTNTSSTGTTGCTVANCQACYESIPCYPACSECTCTENEYGCKSCYCSYPSAATSQ